MQGKSKQFKKTSKGFTLVEMIIYVTFVAVISVIATNSIITMSNTFSNLRVTRDINNTATVAIERVVREIRRAYDIDQANSSFGAHPGRLTLNTTASDDSDTTVEFYVSSGRLRVKTGGVDAGPITSKNITVDNLLYDLITTSNTTAVKIEMQVTATNGSIQKTETFYNTVALRGSY